MLDVLHVLFDHFLMSILCTPFRSHADKTSNFVDLLTDIGFLHQILACGYVRCTITSAYSVLVYKSDARPKSDPVKDTIVTRFTCTF